MGRCASSIAWACTLISGAYPPQNIDGECYRRGRYIYKLLICATIFGVTLGVMWRPLWSGISVMATGDCSGGGCEWPLVNSGEVRVINGESIARGEILTTITFPKGVIQGEPMWFQIDLDLRVQLAINDPHLLSGEPTYLSVGVGDGAAFLLGITQDPVEGRCLDSPSLRWATFGLVSGSQAGVVDCSGQFALFFQNLLQQRSVVGGVPTTVVMQSDSSAVERVSISNASRIVGTYNHPDQLHLSVEIDNGRGDKEEYDKSVLHIRVRLLRNNEDVDGGSVELIQLDRSGKQVAVVRFEEADHRYIGSIDADLLDRSILLLRGASEGLVTQQFLTKGSGTSSSGSWRVSMAIALVGAGVGLSGMSLAARWMRRRRPLD